MGLVINIEAFDPNFHLFTPDSTKIILPRLLASIMMHLNVEPEIRQAIKMMKYCINHPHMFLGVNQKGNYNYFALCGPFMLAMSQATIGITIEILVMIYLTSLKNLLDIIMKFVGLATIQKFDNMYAAALFETKMKKACG